MSYNPFPEYRKIGHKENPENDEELEKALKAVTDRIVQTNPWHTWWEGFFPFLLFIIYIALIVAIPLLMRIDILSFMMGSILTLTVVALYLGNKKGRDD